MITMVGEQPYINKYKFLFSRCSLALVVQLFSTAVSTEESPGLTPAEEDDEAEQLEYFPPSTTVPRTVQTQISSYMYINGSG